MKLKTLTQPYNDGVVKFYSVSNIAAPGDMKKDGLTLKLETPLPYEERTVGMNRYWTAMQAQARIDLVIRAPQIRAVNVHDVVVLCDDEQYDIKQIQYPPDVEPPSMDLSLERLATRYEFGGAV
jgi:hypothetical protein